MPGLGELLAVAFARGSRDPEIRDQRVPAGKEDVLGLDVPVNDTASVGMAEGVRDLERDLDRILDGKLPFADQPVAQGLALDERHHIVEQAVGFTGIDEPEDVRMLELGSEPDLALEAIAPHGDRQLGMKDLDGNLAAVTDVLRQEDGRHASAAKLSLDLVPVSQPIMQPGQSVQDGSRRSRPMGTVSESTRPSWRGQLRRSASRHR